MSELKNESVFINPEDKSFSLKTVPVPVPTHNDVLLSIQSTGICATDVHLWSWGKVGDAEVKKPAVLGHESCGRVVALGPCVKDLKIGDLVTIECTKSCFDGCEFCTRGSYHLCPDRKCTGLPPNDGLFTRYYAHDANLCFKLPAHISDEEGAMVEPLSVAVHACRRAKVSAGDTVLICGAGPIGLLVLLVSKAMGAAKVLVTDVREDRVDIARRLGATHTKIVGLSDEKATARRIQDILGDAPSISLDCCGSETTLKTCLYATKSGGVTVVVGVGPGELMSVPIVEAALREVDIKGIFGYPNCYRRAIALLASGAVDVKPLITHKFKLADLPRAMEIVKQGAEGTVKVIIKCQE